MAQTQNGPPGPESGRRRAVRWWLSGATFVVGLFVGAIVVGLLGEGATIVPSQAAATSTPAGRSAGASSSPASSSASIAVNDACLQALDAARQVNGIVGDAGQALSHFNATRLDELVRQLQSLQSRLRSDIGDCRISTGLPGGSAAPATPTATTSPGA